jgi:DNA-binding NtrC family response regulator
MVKNSRLSGSPGGVLRVVLIDDSSTSGDVLVGALRQSGREVLVERADHEDSLVSLLRGFWPDVVFTTSHAHLGLPAVLAAVRTVRPTVPVIMMAAPGDEHRTASWIRAGVEEVVRRDSAGQTAAAAVAAQPPADRGPPAHHRGNDQPRDRRSPQTQREDGGDSPERRGPAARHS